MFILFFFFLYDVFIRDAVLTEMARTLISGDGSLMGSRFIV